MRTCALISSVCTGVIGETEMTMDIPEYGTFRRPGKREGEPINQFDRDYHANRSRGMGGNPTTGAEENLLGYPVSVADVRAP